MNRVIDNKEYIQEWVKKFGKIPVDIDELDKFIVWIEKRKKEDKYDAWYSMIEQKIQEK